MRSEDRVNTINDIIVGISRRCVYKFNNKSVEDISQELWVKVLEKETRIGHDIDLNLIAKICYDHIVDMIRYESSRNSSYIEEIVEDYNMYSRYLSDDVDHIIIEDLLDTYPEGSKEKIFLEYWSMASNYKDYGVIGEGTYNEGYTESDLAKKLGYSGTSSGGYKKFRNKMRTLVIKIIYK